jgi:hypothetical protein
MEVGNLRVKPFSSLTPTTPKPHPFSSRALINSKIETLEHNLESSKSIFEARIKPRHLKHVKEQSFESRFELSTIAGNSYASRPK